MGVSRKFWFWSLRKGDERAVFRQMCRQMRWEAQEFGVPKMSGTRYRSAAEKTSMCGIAGYAGRPHRDVLEEMGNALRHRGPDDAGTYVAPGVGFAFRRLSIIDVAGGHQPLANADKTIWVQLNGEIYNFAELRRELEGKGYRFMTKSDTETIVHAYDAWGDACFTRLDGMFAIAIWDTTRSRLVIARDRMGKKPLYWTVKDGTLWFASELKALLAAGVVSRDIDPIALGMYFRTDAVPTPRSIFRDVQKLEPATALAWSRGAIEKTWSFWSCPTDVLADISLDAAVAGLRERLDRAVKRRLIADVPLGLFLSGGIDSTVVAESAARQSSSRLNAFTIGFEDKTYDEREAARTVARSLGIDLHEEVLKPTDALGMLETATALLDEPLSDPSILPQLLLSQFTKRHVTVALSGDGGDELFLGYPHLPLHEVLNRYPFLGMSAVANILRNIPARSGYFSLGFKMQRLARGLDITDPWDRDLEWRGAYTEDELRRLLVPAIAEAADVRRANSELHQRAMEASGDFWKQWTWSYLRTYLMDDVLVKVDRATMRFGLEARAPLLDTAVVEYALRLPSRWKTGKYGNKFLLKELMRGRVPDHILRRPKHGFAVPVAEWLSGPLAPQVDELSSPTFLSAQGLFDPAAVARLRRDHARGTDRRKELWTFFVFQLWYRAWKHA